MVMGKVKVLAISISALPEIVWDPLSVISLAWQWPAPEWDLDQPSHRISDLHIHVERRNFTETSTRLGLIDIL